MAKTAFLFSGQGAQYPGMMPDLASAYPAAKSLFERADAQLGMNLSGLIMDGPAEELNHTENTQPALLTCEIAALTVLRDAGVRPDYLAGFSLGEWAALVAGEVIPFETALDIVRKRANYMQSAVPIGEGGMAVILRRTAEEVEALCAACGDVTPSNYNCPGQITVAGKSDAIDRLMQKAERDGVIAKRLAISVPSHCALMQPAADRLAAALQETPFSDATLPVVMNCTAAAEQNGAEIKSNMIRQLTMPVRFEESIRRMLEEGVDTFVELGPGKTLVGLVKKTAKAAGATVTTLTTDGVMEQTLNALCGGAYV